MQLIKDKKIIEDTWEYVDDSNNLPAGDIIVTVEQWQASRDLLQAHAGKLGLQIASAQAIEEVAEQFAQFDLVELNFTAFTDGRAFSQAWLIRSRFDFQGEIRASGAFMPDQLFYLQRVGVNAFKFTEDSNLEQFRALLNDFSVSYQASVN